MLADAAVRRLVLAVAGGAVERVSASRMLASSAYTLEELERAGLVAIRGDQVWLAFSYLTADDQRRIARHARGLGIDLANRILTARTQLERLAATVSTRSDVQRRLLFFVVGCMALDWDALRFTQDAGYRAAATVSRPDYAYTPWMKEDAPDLSRRGLYWGSHNAVAGPYTFTTFGDHHALPRHALPDVTFRGGAPFPLESLARILTAVHEGASDEAAIASVTGLDDVRTRIEFLESLAFVRRTSGRVESNVTVLSATVAPTVKALRDTVMAEVDRWHAERYEQTKANLGDLTPVRQGVPFAVVYTEVWHYVFGYANLHLSQSGLIADPYDRNEPFVGFIPFVWASSLSGR